MQPRQTALLALAAILLGAYIYAVEIRGSGEDEAVAQVERLLFAGLDTAAISALEITTEEGQPAVLEREERGWRLRAPLEFPASESVVDAILAAIGGAERDGSVTPGVDLSVFGLGDSGTRIAFEAGDQRHTFEVGGETPVGRNRYVHVDGRADVDLVASHRLRALSLELGDLRDHRVLPFETASVDRVQIAWPGVAVSLERRAGVWWMTAPIEARGDAETIDTLLADIAYLRADGFVDDGTPEVMRSLEVPVFAMGLDGAGIGPAGLRLEAAQAAGEGASVTAVRGRDGFVYEVAVERFDDWPRRVAAYRDKSLARFDAAAARVFELDLSSEVAEGTTADVVRIRGDLIGGSWVTGDESMSAEDAATLISTLARLEGSDVIAESVGAREAAGLGLAPPRVRLRAWGEGEGDRETGTDTMPLLADVVFGRSIPGLGVVARAGAASPILVLDQSIAESIPTSLESFRSDFVDVVDEGDALEGDAQEAFGSEDAGADALDLGEDGLVPEI